MHLLPCLFFPLLFAAAGSWILHWNGQHHDEEHRYVVNNTASCTDVETLYMIVHDAQGQSRNQFHELQFNVTDIHPDATSFGLFTTSMPDVCKEQDLSFKPRRRCNGATADGRRDTPFLLDALAVNKTMWGRVVCLAARLQNSNCNTLLKCVRFVLLPKTMSCYAPTPLPDYRANKANVSVSPTEQVTQPGDVHAGAAPCRAVNANLLLLATLLVRLII
eukprot:scpid73288/ scgid0275/ 